jgi:hypothetical protein
VKARIAAYAGVQLGDYFTGRGLLALAVTALAAWGYGAVNGFTLSVFDPSASMETREQLQRAFDILLATFALVAAALSAQSLVARHRRRRYDRVLFANAVSPVRYYAQGFVLAGLGGALLGAAAAEVYAVAVHPVSMAGTAAYLVLAWLSIGSLAFLLSVLTPWHTPVLIALLGADIAVDRLIGALQASGRAGAAIDLAQYLLPPGHVIVALASSFSRGLVVDPRVLAWPVAFGILALVAALLLLRRRPFGT